MSTTRPEQSGFALPAAIFIMVVLGALGGFAASLSSSQHMGTALDVQGIRAAQAARAGVNWGVYQTLKATTSMCAAGGSELALADLPGLTVWVQCVPLTVAQPGITLFEVTAWACNPPAAGRCPGNAAVDGYVERKMTALVEKKGTP